MGESFFVKFEVMSQPIRNIAILACINVIAELK